MTPRVAPVSFLLSRTLGRNDAYTSLSLFGMSVKNYFIGVDVYVPTSRA